jgi:hypothetical protein
MLPQLRPLCSGLVALGLMAATPLLAPAKAEAQGQPIAPAQGTALTVEQARAAAVRILEAVKRGDANARFAQFTPELQAVTSPSMIAATMRSQPKVLGYSLLSVRSGRATSTVEAEIRTSAGERVVFMVLNPKGLIERYYFDRTDDDSSKVALQFVRAISSGNYISAQSFLSPLVQQELTPAILQTRWSELERETGRFVSVGRAVEADSTPDSRLVLVNVTFKRLTESLFVILNNANQITGIDFPEIVKPAPVP